MNFRKFLMATAGAMTLSTGAALAADCAIDVEDPFDFAPAFTAVFAHLNQTVIRTNV